MNNIKDQDLPKNCLIRQDLARDVMKPILETVNEGIGFFNNRSTQTFFTYCEDTIVNYLDITRVCAQNCPLCADIHNALVEALDSLQTKSEINAIEMPAGF